MFYCVSINLIKVLIKILFKIEIKGKSNVPKGKPLIVCINHSSLWDSAIVAGFFPRKINFIAKRELFENKFLNILLKLLKVIPINRGTADMKAFRTINRLLKEGEVIGIFAQGGRKKEISIDEGKGGAALFALKSEVDILPVSITSSYKYFSSVKVRYGEVININDYKEEKVKTETINKVTKKIMMEINKLNLERGV